MSEDVLVWAEKAKNAMYLVCHEDVARDIAQGITNLADAFRSAQNRIEDLEWQVKGIDEWREEWLRMKDQRDELQDHCNDLRSLLVEADNAINDLIDELDLSANTYMDLSCRIAEKVSK